MTTSHLGARIKVFGVGGAGGNAINNMIESGLTDVEFVVANTDAQNIDTNLAEYKLNLGEKLTKGLGAGANPEIGRKAAEESIEEIKKALEGANMIFITAGMGGGTGTGAAPVIAQLAKEAGILTVAIVSKPFKLEGQKRTLQAEKGIEELTAVVDSLITIPNEKLTQIGAKASFREMLKRADDVLYFGVKGISDLITKGGMINLDFADVSTVMRNGGIALMGAGHASGEGRAKQAALSAISSPLLENVSVNGAKKLLVNITSSMDISMDEITEAMDIINNAVNNINDSEIIFGATFDDSMGDSLSITVIATGLQQVDMSKDPEPVIPKVAPKQSKLLPEHDDANTSKASYRPVRNSTGEDHGIPSYLRKKESTGEKKSINTDQDTFKLK